MVILLGITSAGMSWAQPVDVSVFEDGSIPEPRLGDPRSLEDFIRFGYEGVSVLTTCSGTPVEFTLGNFRTLHRFEFGSVELGEASTLPGGPTISAGKGFTSDFSGRTLTAELEASWSKTREQDLGMWNGVPALQVPLSEVIRLNELDGNYDGKEVIVVTTYEATVELAEKSRTYRALFLWAAGDEGPQSLDYFPIDHVALDPWIAYKVAQAEPLSGASDLSDCQRVLFAMR